jgi:hypothetical protein
MNLKVSSSGLSRTIPIRVVGEADVAKIAWNHALYVTDREDRPAHDAGEEPVGAPYTEHVVSGAGVDLFMVLTLADGTVALGGVSRMSVLRAAKPPVRIGAQGIPGPTPATASFSLSPDYYGSGSVTANIGSAHFAWEVTSPQP